MNSITQKLIAEAGTDISGKWMSIDNAEKFAELIVRECVGVVEGGHFLHDQAPTALFAKECSGAIKRHFGVEEPKGWICPKCNADRTKIACPLGFGATVDGRCPMTVEAQ